VQADSIAVLNRAYTIKADQIWAPLAKDFAALPNDYDKDAVYERYITARRATIDLLMDIGPSVKHLLTEEQWRKLPSFVSSNLDRRYLASIRNGTAMFTGGGGFGGFEGLVAAGGNFIVNNSGGGEIRVIRQ
jgi:hypothetical protein